jgi:hypothetical protein
LTDIGTHVPYYRELFATRGFDPQTITSTGRPPGFAFPDQGNHQAEQ